MRAGCRGLRGAPPGESLSEERVERRPVAAIGRAIKLMEKGLPWGGCTTAVHARRDACEMSVSFVTNVLVDDTAASPWEKIV